MEACIQTFLDFARPPSVGTPCRRTCFPLSAVRCPWSSAGAQAASHPQDGSAAGAAHPADRRRTDSSGASESAAQRARRALPHGGTIPITFAAQRRKSRGAVSVGDTGPGIRASIKDRLFEPFVSGKETGLGLGLSICQRLIEAHGGTITGDNMPGRRRRVFVHAAVCSIGPAQTSPLKLLHFPI